MFTTSSGRLQPVWAFVLSALLSAAAFYVCASLAEAIAGDHVLRSELIFRPLLVVVLLGLFSWLLTTADHVEEHQVAAMGLPRVPGALRQFWSGSLLGMLLVGLAVLPIFVWGGGLSFVSHVTARTGPRVIAVVIILISGALAEELMFRGYPFQRLEEGIGSVAATACLLPAVWSRAPAQSWRQRVGTPQHDAHRRCPGGGIPPHAGTVASVGYPLRVEHDARIGVWFAGERAEDL